MRTVTYPSLCRALYLMDLVSAHLCMNFTAGRHQRRRRVCNLTLAAVLVGLNLEPSLRFFLVCGVWYFRKGEWSLEQLPNASSSTAELMVDTQSYALLMDGVNPETVTSSVPAGPPPPPRPAVPAGHLLYNVIDDMG